MDSVNCVNCQAQRTENRYTGVKKAANAMGTAVGVGTTGFLLGKGIRLNNRVFADEIAVLNNSKSFGTKTGKLFDIFEKMGDKIFKDGTKLGNAVKRYVTGKLPSGGVLAGDKSIQAVLRQHKTAGAMALAAGVAVLGILAKGIYNAGKIEGQK